MSKSIYSKYEIGIMNKVHDFKAKLFLPLMKVLNRLGIKPDYISIFSVFTVVVTFTLSIYYSNPLIFIIGIWAHLLIDGLDGSLARFQKTASRKGAIVDVISDHFGITFFCIFSVIYGFGNIYNIGIFFILYSIIIIFSLYFLYKNTNFIFVLRPRIFLFVAVTYDYIVFIHATDLIAILGNMFMTFSIFIALYQLRLIKKKKR